MPRTSAISPAPAKRWLDSSRFVALVGALGVASLVLVYAAHLASGPPIRSDGLGYYEYLPSLFIDGDLFFNHFVARALGGSPSVESGLWLVPATGHYVDKYGAGVAVMMAPFFLVAHAVARLAGLRADGLSAVYQAADACAGLVYMLLGLAALRRALSRWFEERTVLWTLLAVTFGTSVFHYGTYDAAFSHAYSFFLFAVLLWQVPLWEEFPSPGRSALLGAVTGLVVLVRITNAPCLALIPLYGVRDLASVAARARVLLGRAPQLALLGAVLALVFSLQLFVWHAASGRWLLNSYEKEGFLWLHPRVLSVLFSVKKGLFVWAPVLALSVAGFGAMRRRVPELVVPIAAAAVAELYIVSAWHNWWYGGSFGHRAFVELTAWLAVPLAAFLDERLGGERGARYRGLVWALTLFTTAMMVLYWLGAIPFEGFDWGPLRT